MASIRQRRYVLAGLLVGIGVLAAVLLFEVIGTVFLAITAAYVLHPVRERLVNRGLERHVAAALTTVVAFVVVLAVLAPPAFLLYERRMALIAVLQSLPDELVVELPEMTYVVDVADLVARLRASLTGLAVDLAGRSAVLVLKLALFTFLLYALLLRPLAPGRVLYRLVPHDYHDVLRALHERIRGTLFAIYVLQAATAVGTFLTGLLVFYGLGYQSAFAFAVIAGILQFIPIVGPSILVAGLATVDFAFGMPTRGLLVAVFGLVFVGFLPDALIRPALAERTTHLPASVYFVGFTGGVLSVGAVGFIAGPLVVALVIEVVELLSAEA